MAGAGVAARITDTRKDSARVVSILFIQSSAHARPLRSVGGVLVHVGLEGAPHVALPGRIDEPVESCGVCLAVVHVADGSAGVRDALPPADAGLLVGESLPRLDLLDQGVVLLLTATASALSTGPRCIPLGWLRAGYT